MAPSTECAEIIRLDHDVEFFWSNENQMIQDRISALRDDIFRYLVFEASTGFDARKKASGRKGLQDTINTGNRHRE